MQVKVAEPENDTIIRVALYLFHDVRRTAFAGAACLAVWAVAALAQTTAHRKNLAERVPVFRVDPAWQKPQPNHWIVGAVVCVAVDGRYYW